jgi:hypothetical protein
VDGQRAHGPFLQRLNQRVQCGGPRPAQVAHLGDAFYIVGQCALNLSMTYRF